MAIIHPTSHQLADGTTIRVRTAVEDDTAGLVETLKFSIAENDAQVWSPTTIWTTEYDVRRFIAERADDPRQILLVAEVHGKILGDIDFQVGTRRHMRHIGEFTMGVHPDWRSKGLGDALLATMIDWARKGADVEKVKMHVVGNNLRAISLYKKFGFFEEGRSVRVYKMSDNAYFDDVLLAKNLK